MKNRVILLKTEDDLNKTVQLAMKQVGLLEGITRSTRIALKPNFIYPYHKPDITTSPPVVQATVEILGEFTSHIAIVETVGLP
jgi:uncharacterized protein (DUF362 family)